MTKQVGIYPIGNNSRNWNTFSMMKEKSRNNSSLEVKLEEKLTWGQLSIA
jgi:hypothetical protein